MEKSEEGTQVFSKGVFALYFYIVIKGKIHIRRAKRNDVTTVATIQKGEVCVERVDNIVIHRACLQPVDKLVQNLCFSLKYRGL